MPTLKSRAGATTDVASAIVTVGKFLVAAAPLVAWIEEHW